MNIRSVVLFVTVLLLGFAGLAMGTNLLTNPAAEEPLVGGEIPGWTEVVGTDWQYYDRDPAPLEGGSYFFAGVGLDGELRQDVDVTALSDLIDQDGAVFGFSGFVRSFEQAPTDQSRIIVEYRDADNQAVLGSWDSGWWDNTDRWRSVSSRYLAPAGTRVVRVRLLSHRNYGSNNNGYFDALSLEVSGGTPASSFTEDADGWWPQGDVGRFNRIPSDGVSGPFIRAEDLNVGELIRWIAPEKFLGNKAEYLGGALTFWRRQSPPGTSAGQSDVRLIGGGLEIAYDISQPPDATWRQTRVPLAPAEGWHLSDGGSPDSTQFRAVLSALEELSIRAEYSAELEVCDLDEVVLTADPCSCDVGTFALDPRGTYLRTNEDPNALACRIVDFLPLGVVAGDTLVIHRNGAFDYHCVGSSGRVRDDDGLGTICVFSSTDELLASDLQYRVPGAIDAGDDYVTAPTFEGGLPTDIPEDFALVDSVTVVVPVGGRYLFVAANDEFYGDNCDADGDYSVTLTRKPGTASPCSSVEGDLAAGPRAVPAAWPNPSRNGTTITLMGPGPRRITVYNVAGRAIRTLNLQAAGQDRRAFWDGRDADGVLVAPGVYFVRAPGRGAPGRVVVLQ